MSRAALPSRWQPTFALDIRQNHCHMAHVRTRARLCFAPLGLVFVLTACDRKGQAELKRAQELAAEQPQAALEQFAKAENLGASSLVVKKGKAAAQESLGQLDEARKSFADVLQIAPKDLEANVGMARLALRQGDVVGARKYLAAAIELRPLHVPSFLLFSALAQNTADGELGQTALKALEEKSFARFRKSAEYVVAVASLASVSEAGRADVADQLAAHADAHPFNGQLARAFADTLQVGGKELLAEWLLVRISEAPSAAAESHAALAELALRLRHPTVAEGAIGRLGRGFKRDADTLLLEARLLELKSEEQGAARLTGQALAQIPTSDENKKLGLTMFQARSQLKAGQTIEAEQLLERLLKGRPDYAPGRLLLAAARIKREHYAAARATLEPLLRDRIFGVQAAGLAIRALLGEHEEKEAVLVAQRCRATFPQGSSSLFLLVETQLAVGDKAGALASLEGASEVTEGEPHVRAQLVRLTGAVKGPAKGEALARKFIAERDDPPVRQELAALLARQKKFPEAEAIYAGLAKDDPQRWGGLAALQHEQGKLRDAIHSMEQLVDAIPYDTAAWLRLGLLRAEAQDESGAAAAYERLLALEPNASVALNNLALIRAKDPQQRAQALELARRAKALHPRNPAIVDTLGWILVLQGTKASFAEARSLLLQSTRELGTPEAHYHYGVALLKAGATSEGVAELQLALRPGEAGPAGDWVADAKAQLAGANAGAKGSVAPGTPPTPPGG